MGLTRGPRLGDELFEELSGSRRQRSWVAKFDSAPSPGASLPRRDFASDMSAAPTIDEVTVLVTDQLKSTESLRPRQKRIAGSRGLEISVIVSLGVYRDEETTNMW